MKNPITITEQINRLNDAIGRVEDARSTVIDRIARGGYSVTSPVGRAIMRKAGRMAERIAEYQTDLLALEAEADALRKGA